MRGIFGQRLTRSFVRVLNSPEYHKATGGYRTLMSVALRSNSMIMSGSTAASKQTYKSSSRGRIHRRHCLSHPIALNLKSKHCNKLHAN